MGNHDLLCRICIREKSPMMPILENNVLNIEQKMLKLFNIKVKKESKLPSQICLDCLTKLNNFNEFFIKTTENQVILQVLFDEKPEESEAEESKPEEKKPEVIKSDMSTQTDSTERYFIIEELTSEDQELAIVGGDDVSQDATEVQMPQQVIVEEPPLMIKNEKQDVIVLKTSKRTLKFDRFDCYLCDKQLSGNFLFLKHFVTCHPGQDIQYQCYICKSFVKKYRSYTRHLESHTQKRFECDICNQKFSQKITLISHLTSHSTVKRFECSECNLSFKQNSSLFKHKKQKHSNDVPMCNICNRTFVNKVTYAQHLKSRHNQDLKDIPCNMCEKIFASKSALAYHKFSIHSRSSPNLQCENCLENFKNIIILSRHKKKCNEKVKKEMEIKLNFQDDVSVKNSQ